MSLIVPNLYLGGISELADHSRIMEIGITHIINMTPDIPNDNLKNIVYIRIPTVDHPGFSITKSFMPAISVLRKIIGSGGTALVHCVAGVSRSATIVIAYLMAEHDMTYEEAFDFVKSKRSIISPNRGFRKQLSKFMPR